MKECMNCIIKSHVFEYLFCKLFLLHLACNFIVASVFFFAREMVEKASKRDLKTTDKKSIKKSKKDTLPKPKQVQARPIQTITKKVAVKTPQPSQLQNKAHFYTSKRAGGRLIAKLPIVFTPDSK